MYKDMKETKELTERIQSKTLKMLNDLSKILVENNIPFFLADGTCLGGIRHEGYIPWDDDVDIYILGKDYPKLRRAFMEKDTGNLLLHDASTVKDYPYTFPKVIAKDTVLIEESLKHLTYKSGVYIDIFPLVAVSNNKLVRKISETKRYSCYSLLRSYYYNFNSKSRKILKSIVVKLISPNKIQNILYNQYIREIESNRYVVDVGSFGKKAMFLSELFTDKIMIQFENLTLPVPKKYNEYLQQYYGDYRIMPPENERISNHNFSKVEFLQESNVIK